MGSEMCIRDSIGDDDLRSRGLWYGWVQNSVGIGPPVDAVSLEDLEQRLANGEKVQPQLAGAHARLSIHVLGILTHALGEHRPKPGLGDTELAPGGDGAVVSQASPTPLSGRPVQATTEVRVAGERGHGAPGSMVDGVH